MVVDYVQEVVDLWWNLGFRGVGSSKLDSVVGILLGFDDVGGFGESGFFFWCGKRRWEWVSVVLPRGLVVLRLPRCNRNSLMLFLNGVADRGMHII